MPDVYTGQQKITTVQAGEFGTSQPQAGMSLNFEVGIFEHPTTVSTSYCITTGSGGFSVGPIKITDGVVVKVPDGSSWTIR